jgi:hypothetical protein
MVPPGGGPGRRGWFSKHPVLVFVTRVLVREAAIGAALYACAVAIRAAGLGTGPFAVMLVLVWMLVLLWTRRFGLLQPQRWSMAFMEACLFYIGAVCCANILLTALNSPVWTTKL